MATDNPHVHVPPPLLYVLVFLASVYLQHLLPLHFGPGRGPWAVPLGIVVIGLSLLCTFPAVLKFLRTKNTLIPFKPARSLETGGIYAITRNPMYLGLLLAYLGVCLLVGNWWTILLTPVLILIVHRVVIIQEERYLQRAFGAEYEAYRARVRRWI